MNLVFTFKSQEEMAFSYGTFIFSNLYFRPHFEPFHFFLF